MGISVVVPHVIAFNIISAIYNFMTKTITVITIAKERILIPDCVIPS
jgi:hypothetical protein